MHTLAKKNRVIEQLINLAHLVRELGARAAHPLTLKEVIHSQCDASEFEDRGGNLADAIDVFTDPDVTELVGWLSGYAELAGYEVTAEGITRGNIGAMLEDLGLLSGPGDIVEKICTGEIDHVGDNWPSDEPAPAAVLKVLLESLQLTTRTRLEVQGQYRRDTEPGIHITSVDHDVLDEYARQASVAIIGMFNL